MTELKTLKDIEWDSFQNPDGKDMICSVDDLRQEAIKWVKHFDSDDKTILSNGFPLTDSRGEEYMLSDREKKILKLYIRLQNNLTEED